MMNNPFPKQLLSYNLMTELLKDKHINLKVMIMEHSLSLKVMKRSKMDMNILSLSLLSLMIMKQQVKISHWFKGQKMNLN